jgi:hypothetical protein
LEDETYRKQYNEVLKRNAQVKGEPIPEFPEDSSEEEDSVEKKQVKVESEEMQLLSRQIQEL